MLHLNLKKIKLERLTLNLKHTKKVLKNLKQILYIFLFQIHFIINGQKKALNNGYHVIVDKPLCENFNKVKNLISIAKKNKKLLTEAIFFDYHAQISTALKIIWRS